MPVTRDDDNNNNNNNNNNNKYTGTLLYLITVVSHLLSANLT